MPKASVQIESVPLSVTLTPILALLSIQVTSQVTGGPFNVGDEVACVVTEVKPYGLLVKVSPSLLFSCTPPHSLVLGSVHHTAPCAALPHVRFCGVPMLRVNVGWRVACRTFLSATPTWGQGQLHWGLGGAQGHHKFSWGRASGRSAKTHWEGHVR